METADEDISSSKHFVADHPLAAMSSKKKEPFEVAKSFLYDAHIHLLGIRFLKNSQKGFEAEVQNAMKALIEAATYEAVMSSEQPHQSKQSHDESNSSTPASANTTTATTALLDLPTVKLRIPLTLSEDVEFILEKQDIAKFEHLSKSNQITNDELFVEGGSNSRQSYLSQLVSQPITIPVNQLYLYRGELNTSVERCLALTTNFTPPSTAAPENGVPEPAGAMHRYQQCLVLYAESPAQVTDIVNIFRKLHGITDKNPPPKSVSPVNMRAAEYKVVMVAGVEIQEVTGEGKWHSCPLDKEGFKLRTMREKQICISLHQDMTHFNFPIVKVERCFGMLLCSGRNMVSSDMVAIGLKSMNTASVVGAVHPTLQWQIVASWVPAELNFEYLNTETPRDTRVYFTIAVDLVVEHIDEPVRFIFEAKAKIVAPSVAATATEKFWQNFGKSTKQMQEHFSLILRQRPITNAQEVKQNGATFKYEVVSCFSATQIAHQKQRLSLQLNRAKMTDSNHPNSLSSIGENNKSLESVETPTDDTEEDDDEPLASGTGLVSQECSQSELANWKDIMDKWQLNLDVRPKQLSRLVRQGVPEALRPEVWQLLAGSHQEEAKLMQAYRTLVVKESTFEAVIQRDINRTFPAHNRFKEPGSSGQESLLRICKAYSNYDPEIGYCQGLSFLVAALLLHMPEEQAFCVFVRIMYNYGLRSLYRCGLEELHCKFFQLERLLDDQMPELYMHFFDLKVEAHMYASQWFLTLFTTKFPLNAVFLIIDLFLLDKMDTLLQIALALLKMSKNDLLALDFEGVMKYFRISLPKKYRSDEAAKALIQTAVKINVKKSKKYEAHYRTWSEQNRKQQNPLEHLEMENKRLMTTAIRLEQENDDLSQELLITCKSKIKLQADLDMAEDKAETLNQFLLNTKTQLVEVEEERDRLIEEVASLKEMCRKEIERSEDEIKKDRKIIEEYKQICTNHQSKFESERERSAIQLEQITEKVKNCPSCAAFVAELAQKDGCASPSGESANSSLDAESDKYKDTLLKRISDLETELIKTKVALAEAEDRNGLLAGKLHTTSSELNLMKAQADEAAHQRSNTWFTKTLSTIRDAAKVKTSNSIPSGISSSAASTTNTVATSGSQHPAPNAETSSLHEVHSNSSGSTDQQYSPGGRRRYSSRDIYNH